MVQFFYEDGQGNAVDENGWPEPMDYIVDQNLYALESLITSHTPKKARFFKLKIDKCLSASAAAKQLGIHVRAAQKRWNTNLSLKKAEFHSVERNSPDKINDRHDRVREWDETDMNFLTNCVFLDESPFHINMKRTRAWSTVGAIISASGLIKVSVRIPSPSKKRKAGQEYGILSTGTTVTGHYISFLKETLDEMDKTSAYERALFDYGQCPDTHF
ncbi:hypothetical protein BD770DRAFT_439063 [Pilaira anomala]|nr:hypothetical protein BD770DRAFT_439063 [Pilaira anomala]